jgi:hypothetical protein
MRIKDSRQTKKNKVYSKQLPLYRTKKQLFDCISTSIHRRFKTDKKIKEMIVDEKKTCAIVICGTHACKSQYKHNQVLSNWVKGTSNTTRQQLIMSFAHLDMVGPFHFQTS